MQKFDNLQNNKKYCFGAIFLLFISDPKIQTIKSKIDRPRFII